MSGTNLDLIKNSAVIFHLEAEIEKDLTHSEWCILSQLGEECENDLPLEHTMESLKKDFGG